MDEKEYYERQRKEREERARRAREERERARYGGQNPRGDEHLRREERRA